MSRCCTYDVVRRRSTPSAFMQVTRPLNLCGSAPIQARPWSWIGHRLGPAPLSSSRVRSRCRTLPRTPQVRLAQGRILFPRYASARDASESVHAVSRSNGGIVCGACGQRHDTAAQVRGCHEQMRAAGANRNSWRTRARSRRRFNPPVARRATTAQADSSRRSNAVPMCRHGKMLRLCARCSRVEQAIREKRKRELLEPPLVTSVDDAPYTGASRLVPDPSFMHADLDPRFRRRGRRAQ
jgi:hypothetical protein